MTVINKSKLSKKIKDLSWFKITHPENNLFMLDLEKTGESKYLPKDYPRICTLLIKDTNRQYIKLYSKEEKKKFNDITRAKLSKETTYFSKLFGQSENYKKELNKINKIDSKNFKSSLELVMKYEATNNILYSLGLVISKDYVNKKSRSILELEKKYSVFMSKARGFDYFGFVMKLICFKLKKASLNILNYVTLNELLSLNESKIKNLIKFRKTKKDLIYYFFSSKLNGVILDKTIVDLLQEKLLEKENVGIKGLVACKTEDLIEGSVLVVNSDAELKKINPKNRSFILVIPQFRPSTIDCVNLKNLVGIVTDEGGISSHAAIIAREFKIPCIVGTQNATKVLKNIQNIKMDLNTGKIIFL